MLALAAQGVDFRLALLGARPRRAPPALARLRASLGERIEVDGRLDAAAYAAVLARATVVVSTALHEFQGIAVMEAVAAGACPLVPDALCYPEQYPTACRYPAGDAAALAARLAGWLREGTPPPPPVEAWSDATLRPLWAAELDRLCAGRRAAPGDR